MAYTVTNNPWSSQYFVGIGTDSPVSPLNVSSGSTVVDRTLSLDNTTASLNNGVGIAFRSAPNVAIKTLW